MTVVEDGDAGDPLQSGGDSPLPLCSYTPGFGGLPFAPEVPSDGKPGCQRKEHPNVVGGRWGEGRLGRGRAVGVDDPVDDGRDDLDGEKTANHGDNEHHQPTGALTSCSFPVQLETATVLALS